MLSVLRFVPQVVSEGVRQRARLGASNSCRYNSAASSTAGEMDINGRILLREVAKLLWRHVKKEPVGGGGTGVLV